MAANKSDPQSGYDLDVYGLKAGTFLSIHIPALTCICISFICAVIAITMSFRRQRYTSFFTKWSKSERFVVYLAACDGLFNVAHFTDHLHIVIARDHVRPKELCEFYGFTLAEFITAQNLMVNVVAINAFMLMYFNKNLEFGRWDWKLLTWTFGAPFLGATIAGILGHLGTNGSFCYFDAIKGKYTNIFFTTVPLLLVLLSNIVLYVLTWKRIHEQVEAIKVSMGPMPPAMRASHRAARAMSLFVVAFFVQWWAMAMYGIWALVDEDNVPQAVFHFVTTFSNIGGILNLIVFILIHRRSLGKGEHISVQNRTRETSSLTHTKKSKDTSHTHEMSLSLDDMWQEKSTSAKVSEQRL